MVLTVTMTTTTKTIALWLTTTFGGEDDDGDGHDDVAGDGDDDTRAFRKILQHKAIPKTGQHCLTVQGSSKLTKTVTISRVHLDPICPCLSS